MCARCYIDLPNPFSPLTAIGIRARSHRVLIGGLIACLAAALVGWDAYRLQLDLARLKSRLAAREAEAEAQQRARVAEDLGRLAEELRRLEAEQQESVRAEVASHQARLKDPKILSGQAARDRHAAEWNQRMAHDEGLARTPMERILLQMEAVGRDRGIASAEALKTVAELVIPGSLAQATEQGDKFLVRVAFRMSALTAGEEGAFTKHRTAESIEGEAVELCARVMRALFDTCGWRGIAKMQVSCNKAIRRADIPEDAAEEVRRRIIDEAPVVMAVMYRCSLAESKAGSVASWRSIPLHKVAAMFDVETNLFPALIIDAKQGAAAPRIDPDDTLKF
jgi:hypothetical protein